MAKLVSFDIDGTLEAGDPPGVIPMETVRRAKAAGYLVGSCSDRTISSQRRMWREHGIDVEFTVLKHHLGDLKKLFHVEEYYHVGDSAVDRYVSEQAGFRFFPADEAVQRLRSLDGAF